MIRKHQRYILLLQGTKALVQTQPELDKFLQEHLGPTDGSSVVEADRDNTAVALRLDISGFFATQPQELSAVGRARDSYRHSLATKALEVMRLIDSTYQAVALLECADRFIVYEVGNLQYAGTQDDGTLWTIEPL